MKRFFTTLSILTCIFLFSCQKEIDFSDTSGGGTTSATMLVKTVSKTGTDSVVTVYTYNSSKKIINEKITGKELGVDQSNEYRYYRDASGIVTRFVQINPILSMGGIDSVINFVHYDGSSSRYTSSVFAFSLSGVSVLDSTVFVYDAAGKIIGQNEYEGIPSLGFAYVLLFKFKFTYAGGNLSQYDIYDFSASTDDLVATVKYSYDAKTSPLVVNNEAFVLGHPDWISSNNAIKSEFTDATDPSNNLILTDTYTYNSSNRPLTSTVIQNPGVLVRNITFYYQ